MKYVWNLDPFMHLEASLELSQSKFGCLHFSVEKYQMDITAPILLLGRAILATMAV